LTKLGEQEGAAHVESCDQSEVLLTALAALAAGLAAANMPPKKWSEERAANPCMSSRVTRSKTRASLSASEQDAVVLLISLPVDALVVVARFLASPLWPWPAFAYWHTCRAFSETAGLSKRKLLVERHQQSKRFCSYMDTSVDWLRNANELPRSMVVVMEQCDWQTVRMLIETAALSLHRIDLSGIFRDDIIADGDPGQFVGRRKVDVEFTDMVVCALFDGLSVDALGLGAGSSVLELDLSNIDVQPCGVKYLAHAIDHGALPNLVQLILDQNYTLRRDGIEALAPIRRLRRLELLSLQSCGLLDADVTPLVAGLVGSDFQALRHLAVGGNYLSDAVLDEEGEGLLQRALPKALVYFVSDVERWDAEEYVPDDLPTE